MTNSAVAKWLQEIAAAKAKVEAKKAAAAASTPNTTEDAPPGSHSVQGGDAACNAADNSSHANNSSSSTMTHSHSRYGIITSYNLKTRKKQLQLILPPEPTKPGPGECCGNDCDPCVNTIYWEDLARHQERVKKLKAEYEAECKALESGEEDKRVDDKSAAAATLSSVTQGLTIDDNLEMEDEHGESTEGLSIRSYRPFKILRKSYISENTLLVVCDVPYPMPRTRGSSQQQQQQQHLDAVTNAMFHILIRFKCRDQQYVTKAFTPVDLSFRSSHRLRTNAKRTLEQDSRNGVLGDKMAFLVKLYPSPHPTSDMFRQLQEYSHQDNTETRDISEGQEQGVLYLRGPIQTAKDMQQNRDRVLKRLDEELDESTLDNSHREHLRESRKWNKERIFMIAAGSGITPMYQVLRAVHQQQQHQLQHQQQDEQHHRHTVSGDSIAKELDLIYCNRDSSEIWLRQELQEICLPSHTPHYYDNDRSSAVLASSNADNTRDADDTMSASGKGSESAAEQTLTRKVLIHHVLSSCIDQDQDPSPEDIHPHERIHVGSRITLDLLQKTLQGNMMSDTEHTSLPKEGEYLRILVCGPPSFNTDVSKMLDQLGCAASDQCEIHVLE